MEIGIFDVGDIMQIKQGKCKKDRRIYKEPAK